MIGRYEITFCLSFMPSTFGRFHPAAGFSDSDRCRDRLLAIAVALSTDIKGSR